MTLMMTLMTDDVASNPDRITLLQHRPLRGLDKSISNNMVAPTSGRTIQEEEFALTRHVCP